MGLARAGNNDGQKGIKKSNGYFEKIIPERKSEIPFFIRECLDRRWRIGMPSIHKSWITHVVVFAGSKLHIIIGTRGIDIDS